MADLDQFVDSLCKNSFAIIDDFLPVHHYKQLLNLVGNIYEDGQFKTARIGRQQNTQHNQSIRRDKIYWLEKPSEHPAIHPYFEMLNKIIALLNQTLFLALVEFEAHLAVYQPGDFYRRHIDQFTDTSDRRISCVYYLNPGWQDNFGGELKLYNNQDQLLCTTLPLGNRFICFTSNLPHEVCETRQTRYSITSWLKIRSQVPVPLLINV
ncbi:2OG-Fe(II) oxygenase [Legionella spiritensis]|uniref:2OG-Fe(II) oxygenase n=1 Tax=Legionella spiritensis TaxID=452 RepID=UPI000F6DEBA3|nr:2OG-Fe(II) oxygenase [Legionella spiritensis]VEG91986.1 2OG-Fe(II) oxygenase [Legionella spiritensis]